MKSCHVLRSCCTLRCCHVLIAALLASCGLAAHAGVTFTWVSVGDPGNACDQKSFGCYGDVDYAFRIATHEVTNAQYVEFLNAKAASDPLELYNTGMSGFLGGITRSGSAGSYVYSTMSGRENMPVTRVSFFDALRFANWMHNGQGDGDTETGAYTLFGGTPIPDNLMVQRNQGAVIWLATDAEWYKAAYYDTDLGIYYDYPAGSDTLIACTAPGGTPNTANCDRAVNNFTVVGSYSSAVSPNGTSDQSGNASEWVDGDAGILENRIIRGGAYYTPPHRLDGEIREYDDPWFENASVGFRLATVADGPICGDAVCEGDETPINCPVDCGDVCGDGNCTGNETLQNCPQDCACETNEDCDDGAFCNGAETCVDGACQAGAVVNCNDGVACTIDSCNEAADVCDHAPLDAACDDGGYCNGNEWCDAQLGCQAGTFVECDDGIGCTTDVCWESIDKCVYTPNHDACDNGVFCDGEEVCDPNLDCQPGDDPCDDGQTCNEAEDECEGGCAPRWGSCSKNSDCCSNRCARFWGFCR